ncbi:acyltransferase [Cupriavidus necator]|uniref:acyltransferase family protein n=1 Tax=Cupriavidus necator TaxID=106590 RepID=UPI003ECE83E8
MATIKAFEGIRGVAATMVALHHLKIWANIAPPIKYGHLFVELFFVLSGYVICKAYANRLGTPGEFRAFVERRVARLVPLLLFSTIAFVLMVNALVLVRRLAVAAGHGQFITGTDALAFKIPTLYEIAGTVTLTHSLGFFDRMILNYASWSISTEFYTYLLFALLCLALRGTARYVAFGIVAIGGVAASLYGAVVTHDCLNAGKCLNMTYDFGLARCFAAFFVGATLSHLTTYTTRYALQAQWLGFVGAAVSFALIPSVPAAAFFTPAAFVLLIYGLSIDRGPVASIFKTALAQRLGLLSYSIYLMHPVIQEIFSPIAARATSLPVQVAVVAVYLAVIYVVASLTYKFVEVPGKTLFAKRRPSEAGAATAS